MILFLFSSVFSLGTDREVRAESMAKAIFHSHDSLSFFMPFDRLNHAAILAIVFVEGKISGSTCCCCLFESHFDVIMCATPGVCEPFPACVRNVQREEKKTVLMRSTLAILGDDAAASDEIR